tara:strand:- start:1309 stop:1500 length:192 start_codon:yes stop_codon:yes gene_type:complete
MGYLTVYIVIGLVFIMIIESLGRSLRIDIEFSNKERIVISLLWPLALLIFIITIIVEIIKHSR